MWSRSSFIFRGQRLLVASSDGRGFIVEEDQIIAQTRTGKQVLNLSKEAEAAACAPARGDTVAVIGTNRRLLLFPAAELPTMARGRGVILQRYREGTLSDIRMFDLEDGLGWRTGAGMRVDREVGDWLGKRGAAGRVRPKGFPKSNRFS